MPAIQKVSDIRPDRIYHVWYRRPEGDFKCVICGGISFTPNNLCECVRYEKLTEEERRMCPQRDEPVGTAAQTEKRGKKK